MSNGYGMRPSEENLIKVLIIDDSAFMRKSLTLMLESDQEIRVVATARDGNDGIDKISKLKPDIVTLDIEMPGMDGLTALKVIMEQMPLPVLMVSSLTTEGAQATMQAFDLGAVDFISKDLASISTNIKNIKGELIDKIKQIARSRLIQTRFRMRRLVQSSREKKRQITQAYKAISFESVAPDFQAVVVGISTGGPEALNKLIPKIPEHFPIGMAIVQHMPPHFTKSLAERLNSISKVSVKEAEQGEVLERGKVLIAPGGKQMTFSNDGPYVTTIISDEPINALYRPSADIMMKSAASSFRGPLLGVIMTGMGKDGVEGLKEIKSKGGYVIAQDEESCVVYGMPQVALEEGVVDSMVSLDNISLAFDRLTKLRGPVYRPVVRGEGI
jgi:two-component system chemotaxis response regulator CheB